MPKRVSEDERVILYFQTAPVAKVEYMLTVVKALVKGRLEVVAGPLSTPKPAKKKSVTKKATPVAAQTTNTNMETKDAD